MCDLDNALLCVLVRVPMDYIVCIFKLIAKLGSVHCVPETQCGLAVSVVVV